ncbi:MAG: YcaQ family DNA glycosylase [Deltaproteobacteria bacterium]|uniref:winged helix-turn-helix domain-containing protein n=1 Tax=Desulfobacula sp. TaxID=2593537 RepID=UPI00198C839F|nr:YcaQ family DNA glycosylase [Candidatus Desulfobacula maris]MBL6996685.1 YcaQ family DNA glycosylase [Desulfobacula sp.]
MKILKITKKRARRIAVYSSLINSDRIRSRGEKGILQTIDHLGYVQIDTISVVERAHHHTLRNRKQDYTHDHLDSLLSQDRQVFEYWGHAASILPVKDYRFYLPYMDRCRNPSTGWVQKRKEKCSHVIEDVYNRIKEEGPLSSRDFKPEPGRKRNGWWDWKPTKTALEILFSEGRVMVSGRNGFQRIYDLKERILPGHVNREYPTDIETGRFFVKRALQSYGLATAKEICEHIYIADKQNTLKALSDMTEKGEVIPVRIASLESCNYVMLKESVNRLLRLNKLKNRLRFLSPFDNLVIQRERIERLFDFVYKIECYVPAPKRKFGYFSLPLLWNEQLIGRMDSKADRKRKKLFIRNLVFEEDFREIKHLLPDLKAALEEFMVFNGCTEFVIEQVNPERFRKYF